MFDLLQSLIDLSSSYLLAGVLIFVRVGAVVGLMPAIGETFLPARLRIGVALALATILVPLVDRSGLPSALAPMGFVSLLAAEAVIGVAIGLATRLMVHALQLAGSIAAQSTALAQIAGAGVTPDPMPAMGNALLIAGLTLAMILGLHVKIIVAVLASYTELGFGFFLTGTDIASWGLDQATAAFALGFSLAAPFLLAALLYNVALGAINRAMPQLMVAFVGAPAITAGTLFLFLLSAPLIIGTWHDRLDDVLLAPLDFRK